MVTIEGADSATVTVPMEKAIPETIKNANDPVCVKETESPAEQTESEGRDEITSNETPVVEEAEPPVEPKESVDRDEGTEEEIKITRVDSLHVDIDIPHSCQSGELIAVDHEGETKRIKVPKGSRGESIRVRMTKSERTDDSGNILDMVSDALFPKEWAYFGGEIIKFEDVPCKPVDEDHVDIKIPEAAKAGDFMSVRHNGGMKKVRVPAGSSGKTIMVRMTEDFLLSVFFPEDKSAPEVVKFKNVPYKQIDDNRVEIELPESAQFGDCLSIKHKDEMKRVRIPKGVEGKSFTVVLKGP